MEKFVFCDTYIGRLNMSYIKKTTIFVSVIFVVHFTMLCAGWNEDFDTQTDKLTKALPALQNSHYKNFCKLFREVRKKLLADSSLAAEIRSMPLEVKRFIKIESLNVIVKIRRRNEFHDLYPWELSYFAGSSAYVVPAYPVEIAGRVCIVQFLENFEIGSLRGGGHKHNLKKLSAKTYWKAMLQSYIFGMCDLALSNIGVNSSGVIRYFDNESSLIYFNDPSVNLNAFKMGFINQAFNWPQFDRPINKKTSKDINDFINNLSNFEKDLNVYLRYRFVPIDKASLKERLVKIRNFALKPGVCFRNFYSWIQPKLSSGLNDLKRVLEPIVHNDLGALGPGTSLITITRRLKYYILTEEQQQSVNQWIQKYVE